jgi:hypothetical protein
MLLEYDKHNEQNKTKQNKTKQNKTKQNKTKHATLHAFLGPSSAWLIN